MKLSSSIRPLIFFSSLTLLVVASTYSPAAESERVNHNQLNQFVDDGGQLQPIKTVSDWEQRKAALMTNMQKVMGPLPKQAKAEKPITYEVLEEMKGDGFVRKTIKFAAEPGGPVVADLYVPAGELKAGSKAGIVALHPTGAQGKRIVAGEGPRANRQYALELAQRGYMVIAPDYPSFGDLKDYDFAADDYISGTMKGIVNHMRCVDLLRSLDAVDDKNIGVIGHSLGGHNALFLGVFDERVKVVVSSCGWTPFPNYKEGNPTGWTSDRYMPLIKTKYDLDPAKIPFDFPEIIAALAPRSFFSASPVDDSNFDLAGVKAGMAEAQKIFNLYDVADHLKLDVPLCDHDFPTEVRADAYKFMDNVLGHTPARELSYGGELPRIAGRSPQEALDSFVVADGFQIQLTASEPLVVDPVAMSFDEDGNLYVVEMRGYSEDDGQSLGRIRLLEDTNQDGTFDKSTVYADGFSWPTAVICYDGGVFVGAAPDIYYLKDNNGDKIADSRDVVFTGFGKRNVQALLNSFRWGLDNRIYGATSSNGGLVRKPDQPESEAINLSGRNFSFDPQTLDLRPESGSAQHGMGFDDWGRMFVCSNSNHFQMVMYNDRYAARNASLKAPTSRLTVADDGAQAVVYRISPVEPWRIVRTRLRASGRVKGSVEFGGKNSGYFTSATGVNFFRGDGWGESGKGMAVVGDVGSNIVHRKKVLEDGVKLVGTRVDKNAELVSSSDVWFRPVQYENGPDGGLHILDMYRETIEHPWSLPPEIKQHLDLTSGRDRGRLYRIVPDGYEYRPAPQLSEAASSTLVDLLDHPNAWHRETASRLLYQRQDQAVVPVLTEKFASFGPLGQLHVLYVLAGYDALTADLVLAALESAEPQLRRNAVILSEDFTENAAIREKLEAMINDPNSAVRYQLAFSVGEFPAEWNAAIIAGLLIKDGGSDWIRFAALSSITDQIPAVMKQLAAVDGYIDNVGTGPVVTQLVELIARRAQADEVASFAQSLLGSDQLTEVEKQKLYRTFALNVSRRADKQALAELDVWRDRFLEKARQAALNDAGPMPERLSAIQALTVSQDAADVELLLGLLDYTEPETVQLAALNSLVVLSGAGTDEYLIEAWPTLGPNLRKQAQQAMFSRPAWTTSFLNAILTDKIPRADVSRPQLQVLLSSKSAQIQSLSRQVIERLQDSPRSVVIDTYRPTLEMAGDIEKGRGLFVKHCSSCHKLEGKGKQIGPNLSSFKNRGKEALLINLLDPNREVTPEYLNYLVVDLDGRTYTGLIASQNATTITLQQAEGKPVVLLRSDIDEMRSSGISLMPQGLEKDLDLDAMADLMTYLMQAQ